jgi:flavin reductase (DIM6/NTAB) family NADH-FMN oxidoreductase RutF
MSVDSHRFKQGMRQLGASVCIITTREADGARAGLTATAVCSLSADPASLLCCLNLASNSFAAISRAGLFAVNVLCAADEAVARHFSTAPSSEKFAQGDWIELATGAPILRSALASFDCQLERAVEAGSHAILIGSVRDLHLAPEAGPPLLYAQGLYGRFDAPTQAAA